MLRYMRVPAAVLALSLLALAVLHAAAVAPGNPAFQTRWERTDDPVLNGQVARTWIWGPEANTGVIQEDYAESPGHKRDVQYYDKSRMEINNPSGDPNNLFYVTNGLLVIELMTGNLQKGDNTFEHHSPAIVNVAGDADDSTGPTYVTLAALRNLPPLGDNALITQRVDRAGHVTDDQNLALQGVRTAYRLAVPGIDHQIAAPFWTFMNSSGLVKENGQYVNQALFTNPFYATGYPITEAYWANVKVAGTYKDVLMQCFERRCLTYTPGNPEGFATEAGNVGQHYRTWRYVQIPGEAQPTATSTVSPEPVTNYVFAAKFGGPTDATNDMGSPTGVALDAAGNLYVVDANKARVQKFDRNGVLLDTFGDETQPVQLQTPIALAIAPNGNVYVVDTAANAVQIYDPNGAYVATLSNGKGSADGQFNSPIGIAFDSAGNFYVVDQGNSRVQAFDSNGLFLRKWGSLGDIPGDFDLPSGIAIDANDEVYVTDQNNNRVQVFNALGAFQRQWGVPGLDAGAFNAPYGIAIAPDTNFVYVTELGNHRVQAFTTSGDYLAGWGEIGSGPGQFVEPNAVVVGKDVKGGDARVYVADTNNGRVQIFLALDQSYLGKIDGDSRGRFAPDSVVSVAIDPQTGDFVVLDDGANLVKTFHPDGQVVNEFGDIALDPALPLDLPVDVAIGPNGLRYVADQEHSRIVVFDAAGNQQFTWGDFGTGDTQFNEPSGIDVDDAGNVYVVDISNSRVQKFDANGQYLDQWGSYGSGNSQFINPTAICISRGRAYVVDGNNSRVEVFDLNGQYLFQFGEAGSGPGQFFRAVGIAADSEGYIYVVENAYNNVQKFTPDGEYLATIGTVGSGDGQFSFPSDVAVTSSGAVVVADTVNNRVQIFAPVP